MLTRCTRHLRSCFRYPQGGFTLVEVSLYMGLVVMLLGILTALFTATLDMYMDATGTSAMEEEGRYAMNRVSYDVRRATAIVDPANTGETVDQLQLIIDGVVYRYFMQDDQLLLDRAGSVDVVSTQRIVVDALSVQNIGTLGGNPTVRLSLELRERGTAQSNSKTLQTTVGTRL